MNTTLGRGKAVHYSGNTPDGFTPTPKCGGNRASERFLATNDEVNCKRCLKIMAAERAQAEAEKVAEAEAHANRDAWDALKYTADGGAENPETCERCLWAADDNADDTAREEKFETHTERWYGVAVSTYSSMHGTHAAELENATGAALNDAGIEDEAEAAVYAEAFRDAFDGGYDYRQAKDIAADALPTHVSSLVVSAAQGDEGAGSVRFIRTNTVGEKRYIAEGASFRYTAERVGKEWALTIRRLETVAGIRIAAHGPAYAETTASTLTLCKALANEFETLGDDYRSADHGHRERLTEASVRAYGEAADTVPTHVSSLVGSASQDNDNEGGATMAATKMKMKDVRGDVRIGAVPGADAIHALRFALDERGRNLPMCRTRTKTPIQLWGPARDQRPELELCAACSKVVPTGEVTVTEERVKIPGLNVTVNQKKITPVDGEKEDMPPKKKNEDVQAKPDTAELVSTVHAKVDAIKTAEDVETVDAFASDAEAIIATLPTAKRTALRTTVSDAKKARTAELNPEPAAEPGTDVATRSPNTRDAEVAEDFNKYEGVKKLVADGVKLFGEGIDLGLKLTNAGEKLAHVMLDMRTRIPNPDADDLPDLMADRKTTKNAAGDVYAKAKAKIADDDVERQAAYDSLYRATQNKASDVLVDWLRSFDGPDRLASIDVARGLFPTVAEQAEADPELKISEAIRALYAEHEITLPRYGRTELARYDRRVKAITAAAKEREALVESEEPGAEAKLQELDAKVEELKGEVPADVLEKKMAPKVEKTDVEKTTDALKAVKTQLATAGKRFSKVKAAKDKRKAKAEMYAIIREAADAFELDLSALVPAEDDEDAA